MLSYSKTKRKRPLNKTPLAYVLFFIAGFTTFYFYNETHAPNTASTTTPSKNIEVCFSPEGQCEKLALHAIESAKKEILVQCYSFTSKPIADALIQASTKGISVHVLFDKSQLKAPYSQIHRLTKAGIATYVDYVPGIAHNKIILTDGTHLITGSYNFSKAANTRNAENMLYITDEKLAKIYRNKWLERHQKAKNKAFHQHHSTH